MNKQIVFNKPYISGVEIENIVDSIARGQISGDGHYTKLCHDWLMQKLDRKCLLTHSCTAALEMGAILIDVKEGDEVIMPSFTFVSTANAFVLRGAKPVFIDINPDTLNIDENLIEQAITPKTKAIVVVHYAGTSCDMDKVVALAKKHNLFLIEDAAQAFDASYKGMSLGTIGDLGTFSFHETKNIISGEGGALIINNEELYKRAEIIREKGTNRSEFFRGEVDKYTWVDVGSSFLPSDIIAAFLYSQFVNSEELTQKRLSVWNKYNEFFEKYEAKGILKRPYIPEECKHNAHMYYVLFKSLDERSQYIEYMRQHKIHPVFHYVPLHSSPAGKKYGAVASDMSHTDKISDTLVRMPIFFELNDDDLNKIFRTAERYFEEKYPDAL